MKFIRTYISILLGLISIMNVYAQTVPSSCAAPDSIKQKYQTDAEWRTILKIYQSDLSYKDSIYIPKSHSDTILNALVAVYNATVLPARDTVVTELNIHSFYNYSLNRLSVNALGNLSWMDSLQFGNSPTGNLALDTLLPKFHFNTYTYYTYNDLFSYHEAYFKSDSNYNMPIVAKLFYNIPNVHSIYPDTLYTFLDGIPDADDIKSTIYLDHVELIYSHSWGDCPAGCIHRRYWKFRVYYDCSVEFVSSYGTPLNVGTKEVILKNTFTVSPNPTKHTLNVNHSFDTNNKFKTLAIYNMQGSLQFQQKYSNQIDVSNLCKGIYTLELINNNEIERVKFIKD